MSSTFAPLFLRRFARGVAGIPFGLLLGCQGKLPLGFKQYSPFVMFVARMAARCSRRVVQQISALGGAAACSASDGPRLWSPPRHNLAPVNPPGTDDNNCGSASSDCPARAGCCSRTRSRNGDTLSRPITTCSSVRPVGVNEGHKDSGESRLFYPQVDHL